MGRKDRTGEVYGELTIVEMLWNYSKNGTSCRCKCSCGNETVALVSNVVSGRTKSCGCLEVSSRYNRNHSMRAVGERFGKLVLMRETDMRGSNQTVIWECKCDCGNITYCSSGDLKRGRVTSCGCDKPMHNANFKDLAGMKFGFLTAIKEVSPAHQMLSPRGKKYWRTRWLCRCDCGGLKEVDSIELTTGHVVSCGCKSQSNAEALIESMLIEYDFDYLAQYRFPDCKDVYELPFDFYIPNIHTAIECDGKQHYTPIDFFGGEKGFLKRTEHDKIKNDYCKDDNIKLIRIPYYLSVNEIKEIISKLRIRNE